MPPRPRRRLWPALLGAAALFGATAVVALAVWLRSDDFARRAAALVEEVVEQQTGEQFTLGRVGVGLWPPVIEAERLHLFDADTGDTLVSAERVRAPLVWSGGGIKIGQLRLDHPVVELRFDDQGKLTAFDHAPPRTGPAQPLTELPFSSLYIEGGTIRVLFPDGEATLERLYVQPVSGPITNIDAHVYVQVRDLEQQADLSIPGVTLGPDRIAIPSLELRTEVLDLDLDGEWPLAGEIAARGRGRFRADPLDPLFVPPAGLRGAVDFDFAVSGRPEAAVVEATVLTEDFVVLQQNPWGDLQRSQFATVSVAAKADATGIDVQQATALWGDGRVRVSGRVTPELTLEDAKVSAENVSLRDLLMQFGAYPDPWVDMVGDLDGTLAGTLNPLRLEGPVEATLAHLVVRDGSAHDPAHTLMLEVPLGTVVGTILIEPRYVTVDADELRTRNSWGHVLAKIPTQRDDLDIRVNMAQLDLSELRPLGTSELRGTGPLTGRIWGRDEHLQADGVADVKDFWLTGLPYADELKGRVGSEKMQDLYVLGAEGRKGRTRFGGDLRLGFTPTDTTMDLALEIPAGHAEDAIGIFLDLPGVKGDMEGRLHLVGPLNDLDGDAHIALANVDLWGERYPIGEGHGYMDQGVFTLDDLRVLRGPKRDDGLILRGGIDRKWALGMELQGGTRLEAVDHLEGVPITGHLEAFARIDGTLFEPQPHGRLHLSEVRYAGRPLEDSVLRFATTDGVMAYRGPLLGGSITLDGTLGLWGEQPYALTARLVRVPVHALWPVAADGGAVTATVSGGLALSGHFGEAPSPVRIDAEADDVAVAWGRHRLRNATPWRYQQDGVAFRLEDFTIEGEGSRFSLRARGGDVPLDVVGSGALDMDLLRAVVPGLTRADGVATVAVDVSGRAPDVRTRVGVTLDGALVRHEGFPGAFEDLHAEILGGRNGYDLLSAEASLEGGVVTAQGHIDAAEWTPTRFDLRAHADDAQVQWIPELPPAVGDADVRFDGPVDALLLSGDVTIDEMVFADRIDWEDWVVTWQREWLVDPAMATDEAPALFELDVGITADHTIRLRNNVAEGTASADLRVIGDTNRPGFVGDVRIDGGGLAFLQDRQFVIDRGDIVFEDPWTWDPQLDFALVTDIISRDRRYRVTYDVDGLFSDWHSTTRSDPPLPQSDVNALLWFGMTAADLEEMGGLGQAIGQGVADMLLADLFVSNQAARDLRTEFTLLDRVDLVTGVNPRGEYSQDPRLHVEKRYDALGALSFTGEVNLVRPDDQYWRLDKPIAEGLSLSGWYATRQRDRTLAIGGAYGLDLRARWESD